ncbi:glycosyltransferase family 2 protein [Marinobacter sp. LV10MA510-1]|uniref:glycosyltransferase family 2 protein n=1 Tax=Marinobacter sp. LV10MA510-1 TaxID=1415567 RepID=UPI000BF606BE|nr:galactosyltransferase-related protein [Marinobacter sp. LV10MA510-1]PFG09654.1 GT2 family glycosyltransferase [Marinobacter sp. LV10MA510-1]
MASTLQIPVASVLTLIRGRQGHLDALINGLRNQTCLNFELVIAYMQPDPPRVDPSLPFPVTMVRVPGIRMPLAAARNTAAAKASFERLIFLDVDCIPSPNLVQSFVRELDACGRCLLGEVRYLPGTVSENTPAVAAFGDLAAFGKQHPARPRLLGDGWMDEPNPRALWGLSFALTLEQYNAVGGMDERYVGYGGEETDLAEQLAAKGIKFGWCANALALHQYHAVYTPPLDRFDDILANALYFHKKWGSWCMEYWLNFFADYGLIEWSPGAATVNILRHPSEAEIRACRQPPEVAFA